MPYRPVIGVHVKIRTITTTLATAGLLLLTGVSPEPALAADVPSHARAASACQTGTPAVAPPTTDFYDPAQPAFGPATLPTARPVGPLLVAYQRFGHLTEAEFAAKYRSGSSWIYPPDDGFLVIGGIPIEYTQTLRPGAEIDRFGYPGGSYLSPAGTLFLERALPPQNLNTPSGTSLSNYHLYCVLKPFPVDAGPIAPWFEQLGLGIQYKLDVTLLPQAGAALSVTWLLTNGYLVEEAA
jgi:hypothetical protein